MKITKYDVKLAKHITRLLHNVRELGGKTPKIWPWAAGYPELWALQLTELVEDLQAAKNKEVA